MRAAIVKGAGEAPVYGEFEAPVALAGEVGIAVTASALSHVTRSRASGTHYSSAGQFPFVVGIDGVGRRDDGKRVYFMLPRAPFGGMAERVAVPRAHSVELPEGLDDVTAAAIVNPGTSSWAALTERARLKPGETVLVNGATGTAGRLAVQIAKHLGAGKIIATGRNAVALRELEALGADLTIPLGEDEAALESRLIEVFEGGVDVVADYLWGRSAELLLVAAAKAGNDAAPIRFVNIGSASGPEAKLPSVVLRSSTIELKGFGLGSVPPGRLAEIVGEVLNAVQPAGLRIATRRVPLAEVARAWGEDGGGPRVVFTIP